MKQNIIIQNTDQKFLNHIALSKLSEEYNIYQINLHNTIYEVFYRLNPVLVLLDAAAISRDIYQFINEFKNTNNICIYHDTNMYDKILSIDNIKHFIDDEYIESKYSNNEYVLRIPPLVNKSLYEKSNEATKTTQVVCFLDKIKFIDAKLMSVLYPQSKQKILLYHNKSIQHPQNMGMLSEKEKVDILKKSSHYLCVNNTYLYDAIAAGCLVYNITDIDDNQNIINTTISSYDIKDIADVQDYSDFIKRYI